jgi:hypothetical protein
LNNFYSDGLEDFGVKEELLGMIYLKLGITGQEIFHSSYSFVKTSNIQLHKFVSITTDEAKSLTS